MKYHCQAHLATSQLKSVAVRGVAIHSLCETEGCLIDGIQPLGFRDWHSVPSSVVGNRLPRPLRRPFTETNSRHPAFNLNFLLIVSEITTE